MTSGGCGCVVADDGEVGSELQQVEEGLSTLVTPQSEYLTAMMMLSLSA